MRIVARTRRLLIHIRCDVNLAADDRMECPRFFGFLIKFDDAVHRAVIRDGDGIHPLFGAGIHQIVDARRAVEQTVLGMNVKMGKFGRR